LVIATIRPGVAWAKINQMIAEQAPRIPFIWDQAGLVQSKDVLGVASAYVTHARPHVHLAEAIAP
jgi:hypothetical protein